MEVQIGVSKINKYASSESGDTLEVVERPNGGLSVVLADGQRSGKSAKRISNMVVRKVISLLAEGVRDGPAARAASDYLYSQRGGKVQATLNIVSIDLETNTLVLTRNNPAPTLIGKGPEIQELNGESNSVGIYRNTRPQITELKMESGISVMAFSDGLVHAGDREGKSIEIGSLLSKLLSEEASAQDISDHMVGAALDLDKGRPIDDISVVTLKILKNKGDQVRRMSVRLPF